MDIAIFGAQGIALGTYEALCKLYPNRKVCCFLVSRIENNPYSIKRVPVRELSSFARGLSQKEKNEIEILIATPENMMEDIEYSLEKYGLFNYVRITSLRWAQLMSYYYICNSQYIPLASLPVGYCKSKLHMFMAKFYKDKPLMKTYKLPLWTTPIQVGAVLCSERVADILDSSGENISAKNVNYSELTALYWIWKNQLSIQPLYGQSEYIGKEYYGVCHYRRVLELSDDDILRLEGNDVDVILPYPMPYEPNIEEHHKRYLSDIDWNALLIALKELHPEYAEIFPDILSQRYFYNYNIILARKGVLNDYCNWLFPVLERIEQISDPRGWEREDRYIGYMGETLETLYFMYNSGKLNIVHTGCRFLT